jgi:hypothetical protein
MVMSDCGVCGGVSDVTTELDGMSSPKEGESHKRRGRVLYEVSPAQRHDDDDDACLLGCSRLPAQLTEVCMRRRTVQADGGEL